MIISDGRDDGALRRGYVGGIQPSSQAGLDDGDFGLFVGKVPESEKGKQLEKGGWVELKCVVVLAIKGNDGFFRDELVLQADSLAEVVQMGGCVESGFVTGFIINGCEHSAGGAFAIGASNVDGWYASFGVTKAARPSVHPVEGVVHSRNSGGSEHRNVEDGCQYLVVGLGWLHGVCCRCELLRFLGLLIAFVRLIEDGVMRVAFDEAGLAGLGRCGLSG